MIAGLTLGVTRRTPVIGPLRAPAGFGFVTSGGGFVTTNGGGDRIIARSS